MIHEKLFKELANYGVASSEVLSLNQVNASTIDYLDLQQNWRHPGKLDFVAPDAVVEIDGRPLMYVVRSASLASLSVAKQQELVSLRRALACRGEASYIGIVEPGQITIVPNYYAPNLAGAFTVLRDAPRAQLLIRDLAMEVRPPSVPEQQWKRNSRAADQLAVHQLLFDLLNRVTADLRTAGPLAGQDGEILSLVGRCLFTCFLIDRGIINEQTFPALCAAGTDKAFSSPELAALTCKWLDVTFNGELLPLAHEDYPSYFANLATSNNAVFKALSKIVQRTTPEGQYHLDCSWIDFSHVPVGLLSQVYESYAHKFFGDPATAESIHYTPRHIAEFMVDQAFHGLTTCSPENARVLDPSAGAGVFLVLCFRKLVKAFWERHQRPPNTGEIRSILNKQIRGLDINEHALKLSALSLYLTAIELDADPLSGQSLLFDPLMNNVLFNTRRPDDQATWKSLVRGSLGVGLDEINIDQPFNVVIGNPPWTQWSSKGAKDNKEKIFLSKRVNALNDEVSKMIRGIAKRRDSIRLADIAADFENPLKVPDVPFVWCAMEWAAKDAVIAFALHARLLFRRADKGASARETLFRALHITGILNGTAVRQEKVWPNVDAQFCLLFARNNIPADHDIFYYLSPEIEHDLNKRSLWRVDYQSAQPIEFGVLAEHPYLLKTLFKGTALDTDLIRRLLLLTNPSSTSDEPRAFRVRDYWFNRLHLAGGRGFETAPATKQKSALFLKEMGAKELTAHSKSGILVDTGTLKYFDRDTLYCTGQPEIYRPPLVLFSQTPGASENSRCARISLDSVPVAYNFSFYGYSSYGHPQAEPLAKYLLVLAMSQLLPYYTLMTSARYGIERDTIYVEDIENFPIIPFESLTKAQRNEACKLADGLIAEKPGVAEKVNSWVARLYGLTDQDVQVIADTLSVNAPNSRAKQRAQNDPTPEEIAAFAKAMEDYLQLFFDLSDEIIHVTPMTGTPGAWQFLDVSFEGADHSNNDTRLPQQIFETLANHEGASRIFVRLTPRHMSVGLLAQYRYWTPSRARLCAMDLLREHGTWLDGQGH